MVELEKNLLAQRVAEAMYKNDFASQAFEIKLERIEEGVASISMKVRKDMLNGLGICHGGMTFTLADTAFAYACNSRNRKTVALTCTINFAAASREGDVLTAVAREVILNGRTGVYDVVISDQNEKTIAQFRGTSYGTSSTVTEFGA